MQGTDFDLSKLKSSWTKYDIVQVMDVISSEERIELYKAKKIGIDEPILRAFLGLNKLTDPTPNYWIEVQRYPEHKKIFALLAILFTHGKIIQNFANIYSDSNGGGVFKVNGIGNKQDTNIRSALVESGAADIRYRKSQKVPYSFDNIFTSGPIGILFKSVLEQRITKIIKREISDLEFYQITRRNNFHKALGLSFDDFFKWLEGEGLPVRVLSRNEWLDEVEIENFFSIKQAFLDFNNSKEVYLLGENGDGKSLVLMAIFFAFNGYDLINNAETSDVAEALSVIRKIHSNSLLGIDASFDPNEYALNRSSKILNLFAYGTHRGRYSTDRAEKYGFMSLFSIDKQLHNPITWLMQQKAIELEKTLDGDNMFHEAKSYPVHFSISFLENLLNNILEKNVKIKVGVSGVSFIEKGQTIVFDQLSEGYRSILIFVIDLMIRLTQSIETESCDIKEIKGVVLVDEIDQHLHPRWQKEIVSRLRRIFPQVQFIMTTHSPTIIQGAGDDAIIYRVYRDKDTGETKISDAVYRKDLDNLMVNSLITHPIFGLESARLDEDNEDADTCDDYLQYRISKNVREKLNIKRIEGANFVSDQEIDELINEIIEKEIGNDKN
ncbi:MAG: AAA family ATPase [Sphingobacterium sp.]|jgi:predicted ATPase|uniref:AAA family ATPase n=1 Tax=Sphingobacterium sp. TaxID=341027 RepID=UPI00284B298B|nr:AAA family ATPase [Sphingobacterium sp.]MDR3009459.1 AAA family ATPase [Sphingobacterium sp.]